MKYILIFVFVLIQSTIFAQKTDSIPSTIFSWGTQLHYGSIFAHSEAVENTAGSRPFGIQVDAVWQKISQKVWDNCNCSPKTGISLSYYNYDNRYLGHSINAGYFLEPNFKLLKNWDVSLRGTFGLSYLTNPYDSIRNPNNQSYSLPMSVYLGVGIGNHFKITPQLKIGLYLNYQHISNGGLKDPNKGINWITTSLGLFYTPKLIEIPVRERKVFERNKPIQIEIFGFVSNKAARVGDKNRHFILGTGLQISKQVSRLSSLLVGSEICYDGATAQRMEYDNIKGNAWSVGLLAGHQFLLGKFTFSQQIGVYLYQNNPYFDAWYHRWGIMYCPSKKIGVGFNLKVHRHIANFGDVRISYRVK